MRPGSAARVGALARNRLRSWARMRAWRCGKRRLAGYSAHGRHRYRPEDFGLQEHYADYAPALRCPLALVSESGMMPNRIRLRTISQTPAMAAAPAAEAISRSCVGRPAISNRSSACTMYTYSERYPSGINSQPRRWSSFRSNVFTSP